MREPRARGEPQLVSADGVKQRAFVDGKASQTIVGCHPFEFATLPIVGNSVSGWYSCSIVTRLSGCGCLHALAVQLMENGFYS